MKILIVHNTYQVRGGEDSVLASEHALLLAKGNDVRLYSVNNDSVGSLIGKVITAAGTIFSISQYVKFRRRLKVEKPDVVHVHNYFPILSPAIFYACKHVGIPVVHTLHNYRAICPTALLMYGGSVVEKSIAGSSWWAVPKKVYRGSRLGTLVLTIMIEVHKKIGTWQHSVDRFITLTEFQKNKYMAAGWPGHKLAVKPNFVADVSKDTLAPCEGSAIFIGRLSGEKGIFILNEAWKNINFPLLIIGDGEELYCNSKWITLAGKKDKKYVLGAINSSRFVVVPSVCYEGFPLAVVESFSCGKPVLCSRLGSMEEIVKDGETGLHFNPGNPQDLAIKAQWLIDNPEECLRMGRNAREEYLKKYAAEKNYEMLMDIYQQAIADVAVRNKIL